MSVSYTELNDWEKRKSGAQDVRPTPNLPDWFKLEPGFKFWDDDPSHGDPCVLLGRGNFCKMEPVMEKTRLGILSGYVPAWVDEGWVYAVRYKGSWILSLLSDCEHIADFHPYDGE